MERALSLASNGLGFVSPNPLVGCVIVKNEAVIAEGYHRAYGKFHAERDTISNTNADLAGSTLYVNLEPCNHEGLTPACAPLIVERGISRVVIANMDTNPEVKGGGASYLRSQGVEVISGILEKEARALNRRFFTYHEKKRPYIILKWAETVDGFVGHGVDGKPPLSITSGEANSITHLWRAQESSILVGGGTVKTDNPSLNVRHVEGTDPLRIVLSKSYKDVSNSSLATDEFKSLIYCDLTEFNSTQKELVKWPYGDLNYLMEDLHKRGVQSILVEGGPATHNAFLKLGFWDEVRVWKSKTIFAQSGIKAAMIPEGKMSIKEFDAESLIEVFREDQ